MGPRLQRLIDYVLPRLLVQLQNPNATDFGVPHLLEAIVLSKTLTAGLLSMHSARPRQPGESSGTAQFACPTA